MQLILYPLVVALSLQISFCATITKDMKMDQVIMAAARSHAMFDLVHDMGDGELMVMTEMDLLMTLSELREYGRSKREGRVKRKATSDDNLLWKDCFVDYEFTEPDFSRREKNIIREAMKEWANYTCLIFRERPSAENRIVFRDGGGCYSRLGKIGGQQPIALAPGCRSKGIVIHEIGHAVGWIHEQARPDRDNFVTVNFNQIPMNWQSQFAKVGREQVDDRDVTYDYDSIMHYSGDVFGERTIATRDPTDQDRLGQRSGLSFRDIKLANLMYGCAPMNGCRTRQCPGEAFQGKDCKCWCPGPLDNPVILCSDQGTVRPRSTAATTTTTTTPVPSTTKGIVAPPEPVCMDVQERDYCERLRDEGGCSDDRARMSVFCRKTCNLCSQVTTCMDYSTACPFFASNGYCSREGIGQYFKDQCQLSCKICSPPDGCQAALDANDSSVARVSVVMTILALLSAFLI